MQKVEYQNNVDSKIKKIYTKKHHDTIEDLEKLLEKGVPNLTMSEIASRLKISLRTLYEIAPSKDQLILMTMDKILIKLGKFALDSVSEIQSPIEKLEQYLFIVNQAVGPKFDACGGLRAAAEHGASQGTPPRCGPRSPRRRRRRSTGSSRRARARAPGRTELRPSSCDRGRVESQATPPRTTHYTHSKKGSLYAA